MPPIIPSPSNTSPSAASSPDSVAIPQTRTKAIPRKRPSSRRMLSCLPCRQHKLRCDRRVPCQSCTRYRREDQCKQHPSPSALLGTGSSSARSSLRAAIAPVPNTQRAQELRLKDRQCQLAAREYPPEIGSLHPGEPAYRVQKLPHHKLGDLPIAKFPENWRQPIQSHPDSFFVNVSRYPFPVLLMPQALGFNGISSGVSFSSSIIRDPTDIKLFWKSQLAAVLPSQNQCDLLVCYYMENVNWLYQAIHIPSFRHQYAEFWSGSIQDIDLIWLSLLYTIISISALLIPVELVEAMGFEHSTIRNLSHIWHSASRQALHAGEYESKPSLLQLQTFLATQLYWLSTKNIEAMNSALGQAVRNAQALGLDKNIPGANCLDTELRRRAWWDLWCCDTFQSLCLDRAPLIHTAASKVPMPLNCNDLDITETSVSPRSMHEPTDMSANICRAQAFTIFRKIYVDDGAYLSSYDYIQSIDTEVQQLIDNFPWYFRSSNNNSPETESSQHQHLSSSSNSPDHIISWQHCVLHISICMQRIRMNRPFLHARIGESWSVCAKAAQGLLSVYHGMRSPDVERFRRSQKFVTQGYQIYTAAVTLAAFLLVERSFPDFSSDLMRRDVEMVISDLELRDIGSMVADGTKVLRKMLDMFDRRESQSQSRDRDRDRGDQQERESLIHEIASVFGGEQPTRKYLKRCDIGYVLNAAKKLEKQEQTPPAVILRSQDELDTSVPGSSFESGAATDRDHNREQLISQDFDLAMDMLSSDQWDFLLPDIAFPS